MKALAAAALGLHWSDFMIMLYEVMLWLCYGYVLVMLWLLLWLLSQLGERLCYSCSASKKRINISTFPMVPQVSFQPLSWHLAYPEFSEQCGQRKQRDSWPYEQDQQDSPLCSLMSM